MNDTQRNPAVQRALSGLCVALWGFAAAGCQAPETAFMEETEPLAAAYSTSVSENLVALAFEREDGTRHVDLRQADDEVVFEADFIWEYPASERLRYTLFSTPENGVLNDPLSNELELETSSAMTLDEAVRATVFAHSQVSGAVVGNYDNWGCDIPPFVVSSCGLWGKCCDIHDACYAANGCTAASWVFDQGAACTSCNTKVTQCVFLGPPIGQSACCRADTPRCGDPR